MNQNTYYHQKLAEQLILLTTHGKGLLARVYHLRKMLGSSRARYEKLKAQPSGENPGATQLSFLFDSQFDSAIKNLVKKFPFPQSIDSKSKDFQILRERDHSRKIMGELQPFQQTFTDVHTFMTDANAALELVRTWLVVNFSLFDVAFYFLDLLSTLFSLLMLLNKIEERKAIMALYGYLFRCEGAASCDVRVETFIAELEPIAKLQSALASLQTVLHYGLMSPLCTLYSRKMRDPKKYMDEFNLVMRPNQIAEQFVEFGLEDTQFYSPEASYLSMETVEKWIIIMVLVCPRLLEDDTVKEQWRVLMSNRYAFPLFRDVIEKLHELMQEAFVKDAFTSKKVADEIKKDIKNSLQVAVEKAPSEHKRARMFLRKSLKSNYLILSDVPGLLGLKTQLALVIMGAARDEIHWLVAHCTTEPPGRGGKTGPHPDLKEPHLAEMLYYVEQLRMLFKKYQQVIFVYHGSMIKRRSEDLAMAMQQAPPLPEHETTIFSDIINRIKSLPPPTDQTAATTEWEDFQGIRLDWIRLQTYLGDIPQERRSGFLGLRPPAGGGGGGAMEMMAPSAYGRMQEVAMRVTKAMFAITFSSKMIDYLDNILNQVSDMSIFFSHLDMFNAHINALLWTPAPPEPSESSGGGGGGGKSSAAAAAALANQINQISTKHLTSRVIVFPMLCAHFTNMIAHVEEYVPIERDHVSELSLTTCNTLLEEICKKACQCIRDVCKQHQALSEQLMPKYAPHYGGNAVTPSTNTVSAGGTIRRKNTVTAPPVANQERQLPGSESARERRDKQVTELDRLTIEMVEVVTAVNECDQIIVNRFSFAPREYLLSRLEATFMDQIRELLAPQSHPNTQSEMRMKPSDMLSRLKATMAVMQSLESYVSLDMTRLFNTVLMQHSLPLDADGQITITQYYTKQYIQGFMTSISKSQAVYSDHFKCFISLAVPTAPLAKNQLPEIPFPVEEFSDITELRCLAEMIGPYGVRYINEVISQKILAQYQELKKLANERAPKLNQIYQLIESKPGDAVKLGDTLINKEDRKTVNQLLTMMGAFLALRDLLSTALNDVLKRRVPFLMSCISGLEKPDQRPDANDLAATAGFKVKYYDPILQQLLKIKNFEQLRTGTKHENDQLVNCFITLFGLSLPDIVELHNLPFNRYYETSGSNALCIGKAVNSIITMTLLMLPQPEEEYIRNCFVRFLTHASSCVLRMSEGGNAQSPADGGSGDSAGAMSPATLLMSRRSRDTTYLVLKQIVEDCPYLSMDALEAVFPYTLVRCAFHNSHQKEPPPRPVRQS